MDSRSIIVIFLILITVILGVAAVFIGAELSSSPDTTPEDTSAYDTPTTTTTTTTTITTTPSVSQCIDPIIQFWYGCEGEPEEDCESGAWVDGDTITLEDVEVPVLLDINCVDADGERYSNATIDCDFEGDTFQEIDNWFARDILLTQAGTYTCRCVDRDDASCRDIQQLSFVSPTPTPTPTPQPTIPETALISDEVDRIIYGIIFMVGGLTAIKLRAFERSVNGLAFLRSSVSEFMSEQKKKKEEEMIEDFEKKLRE